MAPVTVDGGDPGAAKKQLMVSSSPTGHVGVRQDMAPGAPDTKPSCVTL